MTWHHVASIVASLAAVLACGMRPSCAAVMPQIVTLSTMIVAGVLGHAGSGHTKKSSGADGSSAKETTP